jgi:hypothetical protein
VNYGSTSTLETHEVKTPQNAGPPNIETHEVKIPPNAGPPNTSISNSSTSSSSEYPRVSNIDITQTIQSLEDTLETMRNHTQLNQIIASEYLKVCFKQHKEIEQLRALLKKKDEIIRVLLEGGCDIGGLMSEHKRWLEKQSVGRE